MEGENRCLRWYRPCWLMTKTAAANAEGAKAASGCGEAWRHKEERGGEGCVRMLRRMRRWIRRRRKWKRRSRRKGRRRIRRRTEKMGKEEVEVKEKEQEGFLVKASLSSVSIVFSQQSAGHATIITQANTRSVGGALFSITSTCNIRMV